MYFHGERICVYPVFARHCKVDQVEVPESYVLLSVGKISSESSTELLFSCNKHEQERNGKDKWRL